MNNNLNVLGVGFGQRFFCLVPSIAPSTAPSLFFSRSHSNVGGASPDTFNRDSHWD